MQHGSVALSDGTAALLPAPPPLVRGQALFLDFDGTLVEIAAAPDLVWVDPDLPDLLGALMSGLDGAVAIVSGRPVEEVARFLAPFAGVILGLYGRECRRIDGSVIRTPAGPALGRVRASLAHFAAGHAGVLLEDKGGALALHYRQAPSRAGACRTIVHQAARSSAGALAAIQGNMVVELVPRPFGKGRAIVSSLVERPFRGGVPVFVGDDSADEDGFAVVDRRGGVSVRVGDGVTRARHRLATVRDVLAWLAQAAAG